MAKHIYKYFGPDIVDIALSEHGITLKFSLPKDFNDPYELFLTVDHKSDPGALAAYQEVIGTLPQLPTTCFSCSPAITPMWAHYGQNISGFVVEFNEEHLKEYRPDAQFGDLTYRDSANDGLTDILYRAHHIKKPRYTYLLERGVFLTAYFTKSTAWSYERERRMIVDEKAVRNASGLLLLDVPIKCVTAIIAGARTDKELVTKLKAWSDSFGCEFYQMQIGKTHIEPFFTNEAGNPHVFTGEAIVPAESSCSKCYEPIDTNNKMCSWCQITNKHRHQAAVDNPYRILQRHGMLEDYVKSMDQITFDQYKKK